MPKKRVNMKKSARMKRSLVITGLMIVLTALVVTVSFESSATSAQTILNAGPETQFKLDIAYAYVGQGPINASYTETNGAKMSIVSQYPSTVQLNVTRLPGVQLSSCDAVIEFYNVKVMSNTGLAENIPYFIGTNYNASFSNADLSTLFAKVNDLIDPQDFSTALRGDFEFNMTDNASILSVPIGSIGCYSTRPSELGLWSAGNPQSISVAVQRIGYITMNNGSVYLYKEQPEKVASASSQLSNYGNGFLHNNVVPTDKLPQTDLFHPNQTKP
jgi:hypothetical protein